MFTLLCHLYHKLDMRQRITGVTLQRLHPSPGSHFCTLQFGSSPQWYYHSKLPFGGRFILFEKQHVCGHMDIAIAQTGEMIVLSVGFNNITTDPLLIVCLCVCTPRSPWMASKQQIYLKDPWTKKKSSR